MFGEISIVSALAYWILVSICPDPPWPWPWSRRRRRVPVPPIPDPWPGPGPCPPPLWRIISLLAGVASAWLLSGAVGRLEGASEFTGFMLTGVFAYVGARAALSVGRLVDAGRMDDIAQQPGS